MFNSTDILLTDAEKPGDLVGFNKKAEEHLKNNTEDRPTLIKDIELKAKASKVRETQDSINRRISKMTSYWSKGNKKNALYITCGVASFLSVCTKLKVYAYTYTQVLAVVETFGKLVKSRFKRLIFEANTETSIKKIKDSDFLGAKVSPAVLEIADNWNTFVR